MSRGLGRVQSSILDEIKNLGGEVQQNQLLWHLAEQKGGINRGRKIHDDIYEGTIESSFKNSLLRAIDQLAEREKIQREDRLINDLADLFQCYPFKTFSLEIHCLRKKLLPILITYLKDGDRHFPFSPNSLPRFGTGDHELFILGNIKEGDPEFHKRLNARWLALESEILKVMNTGRTPEFNKWMKLLIKGRQLFLEEARLKYGLPFHTILEKLLPIKDDLPDPERHLLDRIGKFKGRVFQEDDIHRAAMKTALYRLGNFQKGGAARLHKEAKGFLLKECPDLIKALPGHKDPPSSPFTSGWSYERTTFSKLLDKLLDRHIFSPFRFLSLK